MNVPLYDSLGNGFSIGSVLIGTSLQNAGRSYTVEAQRGRRVHLIEHLTGRSFWTFVVHYRVQGNPLPWVGWEVRSLVLSRDFAHPLFITGTRTVSVSYRHLPDPQEDVTP